MTSRFSIVAIVLAGLTASSAQNVPLARSHAPAVKAPAASKAVVTPQQTAKPAVRVNDTVLTEIDIVREMYSIFPYAQQHNGFPKDIEADIRRGATDMIIFEELVYQEAKRRNLVVPAERFAKADAQFRKQFSDKETFKKYLDTECGGSNAVLKEKIRRSLLIDKMFKTEIDAKSIVTDVATKAYYDKNSKQFEHGETVSFQTISIIPPDSATPAMKDEAKAKIKDIVRLGRATKSYREFGLLAEQLSEDDWHTKMGDRGTTDISKLPPEVANALRKMKAGDVSDAIQLGTAWVVVRLNSHKLAGKTPFVDVKKQLKSDLMKQKRAELRAALNKKLRKDAKIEVL